jgi:hypothetical protein
VLDGVLDDVTVAEAEPDEEAVSLLLGVSDAVPDPDDDGDAVSVWDADAVPVSDDDAVCVCDELPVCVALPELVCEVEPVWEADGVPVRDDDRVWLELGVPVRVWEEVAVPDPVPVCVGDVEAVPVPVPLGDAVPVRDELGVVVAVWLGVAPDEIVDVALLVSLPVTLTLLVDDDVAVELAVALLVAEEVIDDVDVEVAVCVAVMEPVIDDVAVTEPVVDGDAVADPDEVCESDGVCVDDAEAVWVCDPVEEPVVVPVSLDVALELRVPLDVADCVRVCVAVELGVELDERVRVPEIDAVGEAVAVELRVTLGVASVATGGRATPRSCWPAGAVYAVDTLAVEASMRNTAVALLAYTMNDAPAGVASRRPVSEYTGASEPRCSACVTDHSPLAAVRESCTTWPSSSSYPMAAQMHDAFANTKLHGPKASPSRPGSRAALPGAAMVVTFEA